MKATKTESNIPNIDYGNLMRLKCEKTWVTYKQLCECLNIPYLTSNSKTKQLRELSAICRYEKQGNKYRITSMNVLQKTAKLENKEDVKFVTFKELWPDKDF